VHKLLYTREPFATSIVMLNFYQDFFIVAAAILAALVFVALLNRFWPWESRRNHNDLIGWQLSILGTTYAVILGFMLYTVWTNFGDATLNVDLEADALVNIYGLANGLAEPYQSQMKSLARAYADAAVQQDWPEMQQAQIPNATLAINSKMWKTLMNVKSASPTELAAEDHALSELSSLTEHRRIRVLQSQSRLPGVLWCVLLVGGALTILSSCMFGSQSIRLHGLQVFAFSFLISLCLIAIADINRPFQGTIHISEYAFTRAQQNMQEP